MRVLPYLTKDICISLVQVAFLKCHRYPVYPKSIERFIESQAFLRSFNSAPCPPLPLSVSKLDRRHIGRLRKRVNLLTGGSGAPSYDCKKAWLSINHSILSGPTFSFLIFVKQEAGLFLLIYVSIEVK